MKLKVQGSKYTRVLLCLTLIGGILASGGIYLSNTSKGVRVANESKREGAGSSSTVINSYLAKLPYEEVEKLGAIGTQGHLSRDLKGDILDIREIRDNYGGSTEEKFITYAKDFITYSNDLFEVNHLTHYAEYYSALAQKIKSENFPFLFVLRDKEQSGGRERFTLYASTIGNKLCTLGFDFFIPGDIDEGEDFYTADSLFNHVTYYESNCNSSQSVEEVLKNA